VAHRRSLTRKAEMRLNLTSGGHQTILVLRQFQKIQQLLLPLCKIVSHSGHCFDEHYLSSGKYLFTFLEKDQV
jgi:hypothetical protein